MERYRLAPVRDARTRDEKSRRGDLAAAVGDARATEEQVAAARRRVDSARTSYEAARQTRAEATATELVRAELYAHRKRRDLDAAIAEHQRAEASHAGRLDAVDAARGQLARARADKELVERHFARWRDGRRKLAERRED